jgi:periplasmic protein TonB
LIVALILILIFGTSAFAQSGRRNKTAPPPAPTPEVQPSPSPTPALPPASQVTAEKNQDYSCTEDGTLAHLLEPSTVATFTDKEVDTKAEITARPDAVYTREARRNAVQGLVTLKLLLLPNEKIDRIKVVKGLPFGLTENAIRAACGVKFKPAVKAGNPVAQWVTIQYGFQLANSSIFGP